MAERVRQTTPGPPPGTALARVSVPIYGATLFFGALLLFSLQPMFTKAVLPLLGGSPAVWNTAVVFFQATLLAGYAYAHLSTRLLGPRSQVLLHMVLLVSAFAVLPIGVAAGWTSPGGAPPIPWLIGLLAVSIGLPFFAVSATAPLMQKWFAHTSHSAAADPYFLYGTSNLGGLLALIAYPIVVEPFLGLDLQGRTWTWGYALLVALIAGCAAVLWRSYSPGGGAAESALVSQVGWRQRLAWVLLAFAPSSLLLGATLHLSTDVAAAPFLWVIPLAIYLLSYALVFARRPMLRHEWMVRAQVWVLIPLALYFWVKLLWLAFALHLLALFLTAMVCHGELARRRPVTRHLTEYFLWIPLGGLLGGVFSVIVAPLVFDSVLEYPLVLVFACLLRPTLEHGTRRSRWLDVALPAALALVYLLVKFKLGIDPSRVGEAAPLLLAAAIALALFSFRRRPLRLALGLAVLLFTSTVVDDLRYMLVRERTFFGVHKVYEDVSRRYHLLWHGTTMHGVENIEPEFRRVPLTYFSRAGPLGQLFAALGGREDLEHIGAVGLGAGTVACYRRPDQTMTFFEIDPAIERIARDRRYFHYLAECGDEGTEVVLGDGRLSLGRAPDGSFDLLILDAFSSDVVPVHLLTREALALYFSKLAAGGIVVVNITNRFVDLAPVLANLAADAGLVGRIQDHFPAPEYTDNPRWLSPNLRSTWVVMAREFADLAPLDRDPRWQPLRPRPFMGIWTDDYSNVVLALLWKRFSEN